MRRGGPTRDEKGCGCQEGRFDTSTPVLGASRTSPSRRHAAPPRGHRPARHLGGEAGVGHVSTPIPPDAVRRSGAPPLRFGGSSHGESCPSIPGPKPSRDGRLFRPHDAVGRGVPRRAARLEARSTRGLRPTADRSGTPGRSRARTGPSGRPGFRAASQPGAGCRATLRDQASNASGMNGPLGSSLDRFLRLFASDADSPHGPPES